MLKSEKLGAALSNQPNQVSRRIRRTFEAVHDAILTSAHGLLVEHGPQAVTFEAIAKAVDMTHGNVRYHFGSSSLFQAALIKHAAADLSMRLSASTDRFKAGYLSRPDLVKEIFAAFRESGCGRLVGWWSASGEKLMLSPILFALEEHICELEAMNPTAVLTVSPGLGPRALEIISLALTSSLLGNQLEQAIQAPEGSLQTLANEALSRGWGDAY